MSQRNKNLPTYTMTISVIIQSVISEPRREQTLIRAVNSLLGQTCRNIEIIVVADGCEKTMNCIITNFAMQMSSGTIKLKYVERKESRKAQYRSVGRNAGIDIATGEWVMYLDNDDYYACNYIARIFSHLESGGYDFVIVDDMVYDKQIRNWKKRRCNLRYGDCGTSNVIHRRKMKSRWPVVATYGNDDWQFINNLVHESKNYKHLAIAGYCVCNIPNQYTL